MLVKLFAFLQFPEVEEIDVDLDTFAASPGKKIFLKLVEPCLLNVNDCIDSSNGLDWQERSLDLTCELADLPSSEEVFHEFKHML